MSYLDVDISHLQFSGFLSSFADSTPQPLPQRILQLFGKFWEHLHVFRGKAALAPTLHSRVCGLVALWQPLPLSWGPGLWEGAALLPRALCLVHPQSEEPAVGQQVLYCHNSQTLNCIINANFDLISQLLLRFLGRLHTKTGRSPSWCVLIQANSSFGEEGACSKAGFRDVWPMQSLRAPCAEGPVLSFMLCSCHLEIRDNLWTRGSCVFILHCAPQTRQRS